MKLFHIFLPSFGFIIAAGASSICLAQNRTIDSLKRLFDRVLTEKQRLILLLQLSDEQQGEPIKSQLYAQQAYEVAQKTRDSSKMAESLNLIASALKEQGDFIQAIQTAKNALTLASACADKLNIAMAYSHMGSSHWRQGNNDLALEYCYRALSIQEEIEDKRGMAVTLTRIGAINDSNGDNAQSLANNQNALRLAILVKDEHLQSTILINIGAKYFYSQLYDSALHYYHQSYQLGVIRNDKLIELYGLVNIGEVYTTISKFELAEPFLAKSLNAAAILKMHRVTAYILRLYCELYTGKKQLVKALCYGTLSLHLADSLGARPDKRDALKVIAEAYDAQGEFKSAFEAYKSYIQLRDSIVNEDNSKKAAFREAKYNTDKKDKEILLLKKDQANQVLVRNSLLGGLALVGIIVVVLIRNNSQRKKANHLLNQQSQQIQLKNTELHESLETLRRTQTQLVQAEKMASLGTLVAGVAHELNTPIGVAVTAASTLHGKVERFEMEYKTVGLKKSTLESFIEQSKIGANLTLRNLERAANLIQSFKQVAVDQTSDQKRVVQLNKYLHEIITSLEPKWKTTNHSVEIDCNESLRLETYPGAIAQIITNFVTNSLLHGFEGYTEEGVMRIAVREEEGQLRMEYSDNGRGIPPEVLPRIFDPFFTTKQANGGTGLGMHIVYNLVTQKLGGKISCRSDKAGTMFEISLPTFA